MRTATPLIEGLENRLLLAASPRINSVVADNRGWVTLTADQDINRSTLNTSAIQLYTAGADGKLGTADDTKKSIGIFYNDAQKKITIKANLPADTKYRLRMIALKIKGTNGLALDGEYNGSKPSGNGTAGGNYDIVTRVSSTPIARFATTAGNMHVKLSTSALVTNTVANFKLYADAGVWDTTFFHRKTVVGIAVVQGGGFSITPEKKIGLEPQANPIPLEGGLSNLRGTIAMARTNVPNSATNQWFFNYQNNTVLDSTGPDNGYAVFGTVTSGTMPVLDALSAGGTGNIVDASGAQNSAKIDDGGDAQINQYIRNSLGELPVRNKAYVDARGNVIDPNKDPFKVTRVSYVMTASATSVVSPTAVVRPAVEFATAPITPAAVKLAADSVVDEDLPVLG